MTGTSIGNFRPKITSFAPISGVSGMRSIDITMYTMYVYTLEFIVGGVRAGERGELGQELGLKLVSLALVWAARF